MRTQSWIFAVALAFACAASAQDKPAAPAASSPQAAMIQRADALTEEQLKQSVDIEGLRRLGQIYAAQNEMPHFIWTLQRLTELLPNSGDLKLQLALAYAKTSDKTKTYDTLLHMQTQGFGYDVSKDARFDPVKDTRVWDYIVANLQENSKQFGEGKIAYEFKKGDQFFDALAWDAKRQKLLAGSVREGKVYLVDEDGKMTDFISPDAANGLASVNALGIDAAHGKLFVASTSTPLFNGFNAENADQAGVFEFDLASGKFLHRYALPDPGKHAISAMVVGKKGEVYVADGMRKEIYKLEGANLRVLAQNPKLTSISALALTDDGRTLYVADYTLGIFGFDLAKTSAFEVAFNSAKLVLGGINGMHWYDGNLVIVEDGMNPKRVMRLKIGADGRSVESAMPLDVAQPVFAKLGASTTAGDKLYFVTDRQDSLYDSHGLLTDPAKLAPTFVFASNMRFAWGQTGISKSLAPSSLTEPAEKTTPKKH